MLLFTNSEKQIQASDVEGLYKNAGWWPERNIMDIEKMLNGQIAVGVWNGNELIGFSRAVTDGRFRAYIEDVVIHSDWRNQGIGNQMVVKLLDELTHIDIISLFCEEEHIPFYERNGFKKSRSQFVMHRKINGLV
ncbi:GNAT family N-acetyltransferase [Bacillus salacetis]|uniref:GNAT family N-acetyltransferase n=1 Tax=Bacillus salacetis TaxID=2315464 RepID=UPI003BA38C8A